MNNPLGRKEKSGEMISSSIEKREIRRFGLTALLFFGALSILALWRQKVLMVGVFGSLSLLGLAFSLFPDPLRPLYDRWMRVAHLMGRIITTIILTLSFYLVITPSAWIKRVFGGRPLPMSPDKNISSYWVPRDVPAQTKDRFIKRY